MNLDILPFILMKFQRIHALYSRKGLSMDARSQGDIPVRTFFGQRGKEFFRFEVRTDKGGGGD